MFERLRLLFGRNKLKFQTSILIPVYNASSFLLETLESLSNQNYQEFQVIISIDKSIDNSFEIVKNWKKENKQLKIELYQQKKRLGWVDNVNFLLRNNKSPYFCILPHDDTLQPDCLGLLIEDLSNNPQASAVFPDLEAFGNHPYYLVRQESITGKKVDRITNFLRYHLYAIPYRGLIRTKKLDELLLLRENKANNFATELTWVLQAVIKGEALRTDGALIKKRYHSESTHLKWQKWDDKLKVDAWLEHCRECYKVLQIEQFNTSDWEKIKSALLSRLFQVEKDLWLPEIVRGLEEKTKKVMAKKMFNE